MLTLIVRQPSADLIMLGVQDVLNQDEAPPSTLPQWLQCPHCPARQLPGDGAEDDCPQMKGYSDGPFPFTIEIRAAEETDSYHEAWNQRFLANGYNNAPVITNAVLGTVPVINAHHADKCKHGRYSQDRYTFSDMKEGITPQFCSEWAEPNRWHWELGKPQPLSTPESPYV